jgi:LuxR family maltose regulon positive regulatory protein
MMASSTLTPKAAGLDADELNATKTQSPVPRSAHVPRPRLLRRLDEAADSALTLVCTPPGFGKTALLAEWARHDTRPVAWLSLDSDDRDPIRFWRYVAAALEPTCVGLTAQLAPLLVGPETLPVQHVVAKLVNALVSQAEQIVLILDDYHYVQTQAIHDALTLLLERLPTQLRLIVAARSDPALPLPRLRARGQLMELRAADLRFTPTKPQGSSSRQPVESWTSSRLRRSRRGRKAGQSDCSSPVCHSSTMTIRGHSSRAFPVRTATCWTF